MAKKQLLVTILILSMITLFALPLSVFADPDKPDVPMKSEATVPDGIIGVYNGDNSPEVDGTLCWVKYTPNGVVDDQSKNLSEAQIAALGIKFTESPTGVVSWSSSVDMYVVFVKGADGGYIYSYTNGDKGDGNLTTLPNPNGSETKGYRALSHIVFYFKCGQTTTTSTPVTTAPVTTAPVTTAPVTTAPVTTAPVTTAPVTTAPVTTAPVTTAPVTTAPVTTAPVTTAPVTTAPVTTAPVTTAPVTTTTVTTTDPQVTTTTTNVTTTTPRNRVTTTVPVTTTTDEFIVTTDEVPGGDIEINEILPAGPLPKTGGLDASVLYGLGILLASGGAVMARRKK